jgi:hypothetical protein
MLHNIVENIRQKKIEGTDLKLLNVSGLNEIIEILRIREEYQLKIRGMGPAEIKDEDIWKEGINI